MVQDFLFRTSRDSRKAREFLVPESTEAFGDIRRCGTRGFAQLIPEFEVAPYVWSLEQRVDS